MLLAHPAGWVRGRVELQSDGGTLTLSDGRAAVAEPLEPGRGWMVREQRSSPRSRPMLRLELLGRHPLTARLGDARPVELSLRHAEVLALLALHPHGLTGDQLTLHLYGERGNPISTRAEMSRLRRLLGPALPSKPYRLVADVTADFLDVERHLSAGELDAALRAYRGPLLAASDVPRIREARDELDETLRRAAMDGSLDQLWTWLQLEPGRDDPPPWRRSPAARPTAIRAGRSFAARLRSLQARWGMELAATGDLDSLLTPARDE